MTADAVLAGLDPEQRAAAGATLGAGVAATAGRLAVAATRSTASGPASCAARCDVLPPWSSTCFAAATSPRCLAMRKIAIANPALAPYGLAAQQAFAKAGLTQTVAARLVTAENIGQALQYAQSGNADVALTALSLVVDDRTDPYVIVPDNLHAPIAQSVGLVKASAQQALARQFIAFLTSKAAAPIWKRYGYELPRK